MTIIVVTGTDTGVGKTLATATLAHRAAAGGSVVVVKPVQTGVGPGSGEVADAEVVHRLTGCAVHELTGLDDPLAPDTAARLRGVRIPPYQLRHSCATLLLNAGAPVLTVQT